MGQSPADALFSAYSSLIEAQGADLEIIGERLLLLSGESESGACDGFLSVEGVTASDGEAEQDAVVVQIAYTLPARFDAVDRSDLGAVYELFAYISPDLSMGGFELDPDDSRVRFRLSTFWPAGEVAPALMFALLVQGLVAIDSYAAVFQRVLHDGDDPAHAYVDVVLADYRADGERVAEADRVRLLGLLDVSAARYRADDDQPRLDALAELVRELSAA